MIAHKSYPASVTPRFNIVIVHGMAEHSGRYVGFAEFLSSIGGNVVTFDLRGHGKFRTSNGLGNFGHPDLDGAKRIFQDIHDLLGGFDNQLPTLLFGHSMGSALALRYAQIYQDEARASQIIMSGPPYQSPSKLALGYQFARIERALRPQKPSLLNLQFKRFNQHFSPRHTDFDWISANLANVSNYIRDPQCGYLISPQYFVEMLDFMRLCYLPREIDKIPKRISFLVLWGEADPCTDFGQGARRLLRLLQDSNLATAQFEYHKMRHEILHEENHREVYHDIARLIQA